MYLDLLNSHNFPNWPTVFGIAEKVLQRIYEGDPEFYEHLKIISKIHVKVNPKVSFMTIVIYLGPVIRNKQRRFVLLKFKM